MIDASMDLARLKDILSRGEGLRAEFKEWPVHPDDLAAAIVAFANTDGGQLFLGINDDQQIVGISGPELDRLHRVVDNVAAQNCEPPVTVLRETIRDEHSRAVVCIGVPKGDQRPYRTNRGNYYMRVTSGRRLASREELLRLFQATESLYYDEIPVLRATMDDLDEQAVRELLQAAREGGLDRPGWKPGPSCGIGDGKRN